MRIEIDQSGRVEYTSKPTVVGFSNSKSKTLIILSTEKQKLQRYFRKINKPNQFVYRVFAILIFILLKKEHLEELIIDTEYLGQESLIKSYLLTLLRKNHRNLDKKDIIFKSIGKKSKAHEVVIKSYRIKKADIKVTANNIISYL